MRHFFLVPILFAGACGPAPESTVGYDSTVSVLDDDLTVFELAPAILEGELNGASFEGEPARLSVGDMYGSQQYTMIHTENDEGRSGMLVLEISPSGVYARGCEGQSVGLWDYDRRVAATVDDRPDRLVFDATFDDGGYLEGYVLK